MMKLVKKLFQSTLVIAMFYDFQLHKEVITGY